MTSTMSCRFVAGFLIEVHSEHAPSDADWELLLEMAREHGADGKGCLVVSAGGAPNAAQRRALASLPHVAKVPTAVVTPSVFARGAVTALGWLGNSIRAFAPDALDAAMGYAGVAAEDRPLILAVVNELQHALRIRAA